MVVNYAIADQLNLRLVRNGLQVRVENGRLCFPSLVVAVTISLGRRVKCLECCVTRSEPHRTKGWHTTNLCQSVLLGRSKIGISEQQSGMLLELWFNVQVLYGRMNVGYTLYNNFSISAKSSGERFPGLTLRTSLPNSVNLEGSAEAGRGKGAVWIAMEAK